MQQKKFKPFLNSYRPVYDTQDARLFRKRYWKFGHSLTCTSNSDYYHHRANDLDYMKISRQIKSVKVLMLDCDHGSYWENKKPRLFKLIKGMFQVKTLYLENSELSSGCLAELLNIVFRYCKKLKRIDTNDGSMYWDEDREVPSIYSFTRVFRKSQLQALNICGNEIKPDLRDIYSYRYSKIHYFTCTSQNYSEEWSFRPYIIKKIWSTWPCETRLEDGLDEWDLEYENHFRNMDMCWKYHHQETKISQPIFNEIVNRYEAEHERNMHNPRSSISELTNLIALHIQFPINADNIINILESFLDLSNLIGLRIHDNYANPPKYEFSPNLLPITKKLTTLSLDLSRLESPLEYLAYIPKDHNLKNLSLNTPINAENDIEHLLNVVKTLKDTQILSIKTQANASYPKFYHLFTIIFTLEQLKKLELVCTTSETNHLQKSLENDSTFKLASLIERFLTKQPHVEVLKIHFVLPDPNERYHFLTNVMQRGNRLKELNINIGEYMLNESSFYHIVSIIKSLERIEILKLEGFSFSQEEEFTILMNQICCLKKLQKLKIGTVLFLPLKNLTSMVKSLFSLTKLQKLSLSVTPFFSDQFKEISEDERWMDTFRRNRLISLECVHSPISLKWYNITDIDPYEYRRGGSLGRGGGRYRSRGRPRMSWFREL